LWEIKGIKMREYEIIYQIRGAIYDTYNTLGPGLLEAVYEEALVYFLVKRGLHVDRQVEVPIEIEGHRLKNQMRLDILVEHRVIIEIKSVIDMREVFHLQLLTYLKLTKLHRGVLVNFNTDSINDSIWLKVNGFDSDVMLSNDKQEKIESD
jgi:GxxExxY protein